ncbi:MAG: sigma-70 family RNA polymerase sigma factor [Burkholderiaceae bacterium]
MVRAPVSEPSAIADLYVEHHAWLHGWLRRKLDCVDQAADLAHDTFVRVISSQRTEVASWREPRAYLTTIARNLVNDHWRRQELERAYLEALALRPEAGTFSPETRMLVIETLVRIDHCLAALPPLTRRIFLRSQVDGLVYADIARETGVSLVTVKRHMSTAFLACLSMA